MDKRYFQFPLCLLSFGRDVNERLSGIISLGCVELGAKLWHQFSPAKQNSWRYNPPIRFCTSEIHLGKDEELQVIAGCEYLKIGCYDIKDILAEHAQVTRFIRDFECKHGTDARVRIRTDWLFEVLANTGMSYPEFAVIAAIYSKIGATKTPVRITHEEIWIRALGFKSYRVFRTQWDGRPLFLTQRQVRSIVKRLHARKFFARVTYRRRLTYYSNRMTSAALAEQVLKRKHKGPSR